MSVIFEVIVVANSSAEHFLGTLVGEVIVRISTPFGATLSRSVNNEKALRSTLVDAKETSHGVIMDIDHTVITAFHIFSNVHIEVNVNRM